VRWYLRFKLSYREMAEITRELGVLVAPSTILRWVVRYAEEVSRLWQRFERPLGRSWRCGEMYIKVGGGWMYLYRAVDKLGRTVASHLSHTSHRRIKFRTQPMLGSKTFYNARRVLMGIELMQKIVKGQFRVPASFDRIAASIWQAVLA
jgi:transposase-like protein